MVEEVVPAQAERVYPRPGARAGGAQPWVQDRLDEQTAAFFRDRRGGLDPEERETPARRRVRARLEREAEVLKILGAPVFKDATCLVGRHGEWIGEFRWGRRAVPWGLWAPHHRLAVDFYARPASVPSEDELAAKRAFAEAHGVRYYVVLPGYAFSNEDLAALVEKEEGAGG